MNIDLNKAYYYIICLIAVFILLWGAIDLASATTSFFFSGTLPSPDQQAEMIYQKRVAQDRIFDSLARIIISGAVFVYCRKKIS